MAKKMALDWLIGILALAGGLNWVLVGALDYDLVNALVGGIPLLATVVYVLAGASGAWLGYKHLM